MTTWLIIPFLAILAPVVAESAVIGGTNASPHNHGRLTSETHKLSQWKHLALG